MHRPAEVAHSSFIEGSHTNKNMASELFLTIEIIVYTKRESLSEIKYPHDYTTYKVC